MWESFKAYFLFSTNEKRSAVTIGILIFILAMLPVLHKQWVFYSFQPEVWNGNDAWLEEVKARNKLIEEEARNTRRFSNNFDDDNSFDNVAKGDLRNFNPNLASTEELMNLGFSKRYAKSLFNFVSKGGQIRKPEDLYKIYNADSVFIKQAIPFVQIPSSNNYPEFEKKEWEKTTPINYLVDINQADSISLDKLPGVGPALSKRIINYRDRLGGFVSINQLYEVFGLRPTLVDSIIPYLQLSKGAIKPLAINELPADSLSKHPYISRKHAMLIANYRQQHGNYKQLNDLKSIKVIPDSVFQKLSPYISYE